MRTQASCARSLGACALLSTIVPAAAAQQVTQPNSSRAPRAWGSDLIVVEELRIGALEGEEQYTFGDVNAVGVGRDGAIYVADEQVPVIRMYDARGRFIRNLGRKGAGPGEYRAIGGMRVLPDGRVAVWDNRNARITVFSGAGEYAASHPVASGLFASDIFQVDQQGRFYIRT